jgi:hypothetical protein
MPIPRSLASVVSRVGDVDAFGTSERKRARARYRAPAGRSVMTQWAALGRLMMVFDGVLLTGSAPRSAATLARP